MKRYYLRLEVQSPLSISGHENRDGQTTPTLDYIPGSTLRGGLAWHWLHRDPALHSTAQFNRLLDEELLCCLPLYPDDNDNRAVLGLAQVLPTTARTCKHQPGFCTNDQRPAGTRGHGVRDSLLALVEETALCRWEHSKSPDERKQLSAQLKGLTVFESCRHPNCEAAMERISGYYEQGLLAGQANYWRTSPNKRMVTRSAILPRLQSAASANLYSREVLEEGQHLAGWLLVDEQMEAWMQETVGEGAGGAILPVGEEFYLGAARTAGFGRVRVVDCRSDQGLWTDIYGDFHDRLKAFHEKTHETIREEWVLAPITLLSDAILLDPYLRHASALAPEILRGYRALEQTVAKTHGDPSPPDWPASMELFLAVGRMRRIAGWNTAEGGKRPRSDDWAVAAGSVFVLAAQPDEKDQLEAACRWLETHGIGERRADGFGQVLIAHPFHTLTEEV